MYRATFSLLLAVLLTSMWVGATFAGAIDRRFRRPAALFMAAQALVVLSTLGLLGLQEPTAFNEYFHTVVSRRVADAPTCARGLVVAIGKLRWMIAITALPAFFMGFAFPLSNAIGQSENGTIGRTAGLLYLANTVGAVCGSVVTGFVLIPLIGTASARTTGNRRLVQERPLTRLTFNTGTTAFCKTQEHMSSSRMVEAI